MDINLWMNESEGSDPTPGPLTMFQIIVFIIITAILSQLWLRFYQNFIFNTLEYSETSTWIALVFAILTMLFVIILIFNYPTVEKGVITQRGFVQ